MVDLDRAAALGSGPWSVALWWYIAAIANGLAPRVGLDPALILAIAVTETGRSEASAEAVWTYRGHNAWGVTADSCTSGYGPQLSGEAADLFGLPLRVSGEWLYQQTDYTGRPRCWRSYPTLVHAVADVVRMLSSGRYASVPHAGDACAQARAAHAAGYTHEGEWPNTVCGIARQLSP